ncbi:MAG: hypothetical protein J6S14_02135 [Clostridia bacterium]|nr:hypothetical protein [Clostridia bacterium]
MLIVARSVKGHEYSYNALSAHSVSKRSADYICSVLNHYQYQLGENQVWHIHEVDQYDNAFDYARYQVFRVRKGIVTDCKY